VKSQRNRNEKKIDVNQPGRAAEDSASVARLIRAQANDLRKSLRGELKEPPNMNNEVEHGY
jgi:hypothetical protein